MLSAGFKLALTAGLQYKHVHSVWLKWRSDHFYCQANATSGRFL